MFARCMVEVLVLVHFAFILFVVLGGLLLFRWPWLIRAHLPAAVWGALAEALGWVCPLTPLENRFRLQAGLQGYEGDFVSRYLLPLVYPEGLDRDLQLVLAGLVVIINATVYLLVFKKER